MLSCMKGTNMCRKACRRFFLQQALTSAKEITSERLCVRMDGGNDAQENLELCDDHGADFIIKRNPRLESPEAWLAHAEQHGTASNPREGKTIDTGCISVSGVWKSVQSIKSTVSWYELS
ncbi:hypothetical protein SAMN05518683_101151 [Salibacterium halotolerans]|uniref:Transposase DDE domain group 1 n=1 Tax=Salibacterium halotolerans TaxID=1884432 RepID=A0A1I5L8Y9_9BACI|nr:hypothetical protein SAMN05518683_101151 [Salibacterium halotolerans]